MIKPVKRQGSKSVGGRDCLFMCECVYVGCGWETIVGQ
jgi:hypothetical protein